MDQWMTTEQAAEYLGCSTSQLTLMRREQRAPKYSRIGRLIRWRRDWLDQYMADHSVEPAR